MDRITILNGLPYPVLVLSLALFTISLQAQSIGGPNHRPANQIRFSITPSLYNKLSIVNSGESLFKSSPGLGGEAMISYSQFLSKGFRLNGGVGLSVIPYNYSYNFPVPEGSIFFDDPNRPPVFTTYGINPHQEQIVYTLPFSLQKTFALSKNNNMHLNVEAGLKINLKEAYPYKFGHTSSTHISDDEVAQFFAFGMLSDQQRTFVSYVFKAGLLTYNSRNNSYHCNLVFQYSPAVIGYGYYEFYGMGFVNYGTVEQHVNYLGLEISYGLTIEKKYKRKFIKA
jgi:hypothetical protein